MRTPDIKLIPAWFLKSLNRIEQRFKRICGAVRYKGQKKVHAWVAEMSLVSAATLWEKYVADLLIAHICADGTRFCDELSLHAKTKITYSLADAIFTGVHYLELRNYDEVLKLANRFIVKEKSPFNKIKKPLAKELDCVGVIRNHIVHDSKQSKIAYQKILNKEKLKKKVPKPGFYLLAKDKKENRLQNLLKSMREASHLFKS